MHTRFDSPANMRFAMVMTVCLALSSFTRAEHTVERKALTSNTMQAVSVAATVNSVLTTGLDHPMSDRRCSSKTLAGLAYQHTHTNKTDIN